METVTATVGRVAPQIRGLVPDDDQTAIRAAMAALEAAERAVREAVLTAADNGASVRELAAFTQLSTNTISRWKRER